MGERYLVHHSYRCARHSHASQSAFLYAISRHSHFACCFGTTDVREKESHRAAQEITTDCAVICTARLNCRACRGRYLCRLPPHFLAHLALGFRIATSMLDLSLFPWNKWRGCRTRPMLMRFSFCH